MDDKQEEFLKKLLEDFKIESAEHRQAIIDGLLELEKKPGAKKESTIIETVFREVHSLKGAARAVNLQAIERFCQVIESLFTKLKKDELQISPELLDSLHSSINMLDILLTRLTDPLSAEESEKLSTVIHHFEKMSVGEETEEVPPLQTSFVADNPASSGTVRITTEKLNNLFLQVEELISTKLAGKQNVTELRDIQKRVGVLIKAWNDVKKSNQYKVNYISNDSPGDFFELQDSFLKSIERDIQNLAKKIEQEFRILGRLIDSLLNDMKKTMMFPISSILDVMPKMVRDLAHASGKKAKLTIRGVETEIDRRILEEIKDPFVHIIRNCMDYGIEKPDIRLKRGKKECGVLTIDIAQKDSHNVEIVISDDGEGIDIDKIKHAAVKAGIIASEALDKTAKADILNFIFHSGISTSQIITDLSGRGIGLAIVQEKTEKLGGTVSVESFPGQGTSFKLLLPLMQATFRGVVVNSGGNTFIIPIQNIEKVTRVKIDDIKRVENRDTIKLKDMVLPLVRLDDMLGIPRINKGEQDPVKPVLVLVYTQRRIAFMVDEVLGEQEGIIKQMGHQLKGIVNIAGATVSGSGSVIPILDIADLMNTAISHEDVSSQPVFTKEKEEAKYSILVAEDSITSRSLLKNIIESGGYIVKTAVDGMDAFTCLHEDKFDLLVSDVDMPRLNGFDLTSKIRKDKKLSELPVVLVTALDSREDRERGIDSGANAYIVKSSFDQSNLLEAIQRLVL